MMSKLDDYEKMLERAEYIRQIKLEQNLERLHEHNEKIYLKKAIKSQNVKESEY